MSDVVVLLLRGDLGRRIGRVALARCYSGEANIEGSVERTPVRDEPRAAPVPEPARG